ncbi:MAG: four helix bundle protein [Bacteroidales bacterium]|nr:four helix bundle protein [Bacteroidales bacterium]
MRKEIESRLITLSVGVNKLVMSLVKSLLTMNLGDQMIRSSTSAALNYGEAQGAESKKDFIHKTSVVLKELRETGISLRILSESGVVGESVDINKLIEECNQLTAIFQKTITTARTNKS